MNSRKCIILMIILPLGTFFIGARFSKMSINDSIEELQAELSFSHFQVYKDLQQDLKSGCIARANKRLVYMIDEQKMLMAEYVQKRTDSNFEKYINKRDSKLIDELKKYSVNWGKVRELPKC